MEDPTHSEYVTERRDATFEQLRKLFPSVERAAVAAIQSTVEHVENGSCVPGAEAFLMSLGIEIPTEEVSMTYRVEVPVIVTVTRTDEISVLTRASGDSSDESPDIDRYELTDAMGEGAFEISAYAGWDVVDAYPS